MRARTILVAMAAAAAAIATSTACTHTPSSLRSAGEGLDIQTVPQEHREEYALFAQRCSKCHALARALDNAHTEDRFWERYVERMRRQPGSGISPDDVPPILRFLHWYSAEKNESTGAPKTKEGT